MRVRGREERQERADLDAEDDRRAGSAVGEDVRGERDPVATSTSSAVQPIGRQRLPSPRIAVARGSPVSCLIAGTAMKVSATVPPTQTIAPSTCRTTRTISSQWGTSLALHENAVVEREDWNVKHGEAGPLFGVEPNRFLVAEAADLPPGRALDLACGAGRNAVWLAERGWTVTGADFSDVALANARGLAAERGVDVEWVQADLRDWEPPPRAFDLVAVLYFQVPAEELRPCSRARQRRSHRAGRCSSSGTTCRTSNGGYGGPKDPRVLFTPEDVAAELPGLEVEKAERVLRPVRPRTARHRRSTRWCGAAPARPRAGCRIRPRRRRPEGARAAQRELRARRWRGRPSKISRTWAMWERAAASRRSRPSSVSTAYVTRRSLSHERFVTQPSRSRPSRSRVTPDGVSMSCSARSTRRMRSFLGLGEAEQCFVVVDRQTVVGEQLRAQLAGHRRMRAQEAGEGRYRGL